MKKNEEIKEKECHCHEHECNCHEEEHECHCHEEGHTCGCGDECECKNVGLDKKLAEEYLNLARQIQADFDNYRKRTQEQLENVKLDGMAQALNIFLPVVDVLEKALKMVEDEKTNEGLKMVLNSISNSMKELGVERLELKGKPYTPENAMAIASLNDNSMEDGIVIEEVTSGYKLKNKIIRYAQVVVNKIEG